MKTFIIIIVIFVFGLIAGGYVYKHFTSGKPKSIQQLSLEQVLSIKELHLVKHTYNDLFFLHRKNDPRKAIRAVVQVPVIVTAYLDLKEVQIIRQHDSVTCIVLPHARLNDPHYLVDQLQVRKTRSFQIHVGRDLYPEVTEHIHSIIGERMDTLRTTAIAHRILAQAEEEGKVYVEELLKSIGRMDIRVTIGESALPLGNRQQDSSDPTARKKVKATLEGIAFGYILW